MSSLIQLSEIVVDHAINARQGANSQTTIGEYAEALAAGDTFPPVDIFRNDQTGEQYLAEGFHRIAAYTQAGRLEIPANVYEGDRRAAILHASGANSTHGLRRTRDDKRRAVSRLLLDYEWKAWSDRKIAGACNVSHTFVSKLRQEISPHPKPTPTEPPADPPEDSPPAAADAPTPPPAPTEAGRGGASDSEPKPCQRVESGNVATDSLPDDAACPDGTPHDYDGEACRKCHTPDPTAPELPPELPRQPCPLCLGDGSVDLNSDPIANNLRDSPRFLEAWAEWRLYRRKARKPMPPTTVSRQLTKLEQFGPAKAIKSINASLEAGWTGLFDPDKSRNGRPSDDINRGKGPLPDPDDKF